MSPSYSNIQVKFFTVGAAQFETAVTHTPTVFGLVSLTVSASTPSRQWDQQVPFRCVDSASIDPKGLCIRNAGEVLLCCQKVLRVHPMVLYEHMQRKVGKYSFE
jgi:hypothetical protein